jgi:hypothetical protein
MGIGEMRRMAICENIVSACNERNSFDDWAEWAKKYPDKAAMLTEAHRLAVQEGLMK